MNENSGIKNYMIFLLNNKEFGTSNRKIPVFFHIPKNAGTYIGNYILGVFRYFRLHYTNWMTLHHLGDTLKVIQVLKDGFIIARFFTGDPKFFTELNSDIFRKQSENEYDIDINNFTSEMIKNVFLFFVIIESHGFKCHNAILDLISNHEHYKFLVLREPFSRAQSLYRYIKSNISRHESVHETISVSTLEEYILSNFLEDSWLIRNLLDMPDEAAIHKEDFEKTINLLKDFHIYRMNNIDIALSDVFRECYEINVDVVDDKFIKYIYKNDNKYERFKLDDLSPHVQSVFRNRTIWDVKLYEQF